MLVAPRVFRAPEAPAAREARASLRSAPRLEARPCPPVPPAPSTPVGLGVLTCGSARRLEARPGPAAASYRSVCLCAARPGPAAAHGCCSQAQVFWLAYGSARQAARSSETTIAFACACMRRIETAIAFAGEKRAFLVQFLGAKVSLVSMVAVWGRALVLWVSKPRVGVHCTRLFSPCSAKSAREREKVCPACSKEPKIGVLWRAGRVFSRKCRWWGCVGVRQRGGIP